MNYGKCNTRQNATTEKKYAGYLWHPCIYSNGLCNGVLCKQPEVTTINDKSGHCRLSRHFYCIRAIFIWPWKMNLVSVRYLFYQPMDEKIKTWTLRFPAKENTNMEEALFDWPIVLQYDVKAKYRLISRKFSSMKFFHPSVRLTNQKTCALVSVR